MGIAPPPLIQQMMEHPFGPLWREEANPEVYHKIRQRLGRANKVTWENVEAMTEAISELQNKLNLVSEGQVRKPQRLRCHRKTFKPANTCHVE